MSGFTRVSHAVPPSHQPLSGSVDDTQAEAFGAFLRRARERRGLSLQQIAHETKIPQRHLVSLEHGDLSVIPGRTYRRGEVVAYATVVGLDRAVALAELERVSQAPVSSDASSPMPPRSGRRHVGVGLLAIGAALSALTLGVGVWKPAFTQVPPDPSPPLVNSSLTPESAQPARPIAQTTAVPRHSASTPQSAVDVASASSSAAMANPVEASLVIITDPAGARVTVDGIGWGMTPVTIRNLPAGTKQIRVTKAGYTAAVRVARVAEQERVTLRIPLRSDSTRPTAR